MYPNGKAGNQRSTFPLRTANVKPVSTVNVPSLNRLFKYLIFNLISCFRIMHMEKTPFLEKVSDERQLLEQHRIATGIAPSGPISQSDPMSRARARRSRRRQPTRLQVDSQLWFDRDLDRDNNVPFFISGSVNVAEPFVQLGSLVLERC